MLEGTQRRLSAIVSADVVGYSRLMGLDEAGTLRRLNALRSEHSDPLIAKHGGRIVKTTGDGLLLEFPSVVAAVECCVAVQQGLAARDEDTGEDAIRFRIGIHLGDVIVEDDDIFGDGVNIAARLQEIGDPGGVTISSNAHDSVEGRVEATFSDGGVQALKNIARPVRVWRWTPDQQPSTTTAAANSDRTLALPDKPSIAVLPFDNMSGDTEQEYFSDGITEDIITALSKFGWFFVTARNSTFSYKGRSVDIKQIGLELGVRYVLEGSVRKAGNRVRVTAQLIDALSGNHLWAERYDREITDVFALQDEITETVTATIAPQLLVAENERVKRKPPESMEAWELVMRFQPLFWRMNADDLAEAHKLLQQAIARDPDYALAHALLGFSHIWSAWMGWAENARDEIPKAEPAVRRALELDDQEPWAHLAMCAVHGYARRHEETIREVNRAIELNPNFSFAYAWLGAMLGYAGKYEEANQAIDQAYRISPKDPFNTMLPGMRSIGLFTAARDREALENMEETLRVRPDWVGGWRIFTISAAYLGDLDEARHGLAEVKRLQPNISLAWAREFSPWVRQQDRDRYVEGFRLAGLESN